MTKDELKLALKHAKRDERHLSNTETRYWCDQYKLLATQAIESLAQNKPLTEEEIDDVYSKANCDYISIQDSYLFARAIEAKLKERNT